MVKILICALLSFTISKEAQSILSETQNKAEEYLKRRLTIANIYKWSWTGNWEELGFVPPKKNKYFEYIATQGVDAPRDGFKIKLKQDLAGCPKDSEWEVFALYKKHYIKIPKHPQCRKLFPAFQYLKKMYSSLESLNPYKFIDAEVEPVVSGLLSMYENDFSENSVPNTWQHSWFIAPGDTADLNIHETTVFKYEEIPTYMEFSTKRIFAGIRVTLKEDLNNCEAGSFWEGYTVSSPHSTNNLKKDLCKLIREPKDKACKELLPHISSFNTCDTIAWRKNLEKERKEFRTAYRQSLKNAKIERRKKAIADSLKEEEEYQKCLKELPSPKQDSLSCFWQTHMMLLGGAGSCYYFTPEDTDELTSPMKKALNAWDIFDGFDDNAQNLEDIVRINRQIWTLKSFDTCPTGFHAAEYKEWLVLFDQLELEKNFSAQTEIEDKVWVGALAKWNEKGLGSTDGRFKAHTFMELYFCFSPEGNIVFQCDDSLPIVQRCVKD